MTEQSKKELKAQYKNMDIPIGVYAIKNTTNNKIFVGSTANLNAIWNRHVFQLQAGVHPNKALQEDWKIFGESAFRFDILSMIKKDSTKTKDYSDELKELEEMFIDDLQPFNNNGYNIRKP